jgi:hypothetical protein
VSDTKLRMNPEIKAQWVAALRSGDYQQGDEYLRRGDEFCCLGVLCDLAIKDGVPVSLDSGKAYDETVYVMYEDAVGELPDVVARWAGLIEPTGEAISDPTVDDHGNPRRISALNDGGRTFPRIADLIEEQL